MPKAKTNPIEQYVEDVVTRILDKRETKLKEEDAQEIIKAIIPEIEKIVAKVVILHLKALATHVQTNLKDPEEK
jgi:hypothetical protein